jgi:hypothetical protein
MAKVKRRKPKKYDVRLCFMCIQYSAYSRGDSYIGCRKGKWRINDEEFTKTDAFKNGLDKAKTCGIYKENKKCR